MRELFNLPANEDVFDDFSCKESGLVNGRMYLTTTNMCFYSSIMGSTKKLIFPWKELSVIEKHSDKSIKVTRVTIKADEPTVTKTHTFSSFSDRNTSFKYIHRLWIVKSPYAVNIDSDDSEDFEDP